MKTPTYDVGGFLMTEVTQSVGLPSDSAWILAETIRDNESSRNDLRNRNGETPQACRIVLMITVVIALVNLTSTMLVLKGWLGS